MNRPHPSRRLPMTIASLALLVIPFGCGSEAPPQVVAVPSPPPKISPSAIPAKLEIAPPDQAVRQAAGDAKEDAERAADDAKDLEKQAEGDVERASGRIEGRVQKAKGDARKAVEDAEGEAKRRAQAVEADARKSAEDALDKLLGDPK